MDRRNLVVILASLSLAAGCGGSPSSPSSGSGTSSLAAESAVTSAMSQAMRQLAISAPTIGDGSVSVTMPCADGGSIVITLSTLPPQQANVLRSSSRIEFRDCRNQGVTLNGDPYLESSSEHSFQTLAGTGGDSISTLRTTGGIRMDSGGVQGRVQFNCTTIVNVHSVDGSRTSPPQVSATSTGTTTFEQPLGSTPVVRPCGPS